MIDGIGVIDADGHVNDWHIDWADLVPPELAPYVPRPVRDPNGFPKLEFEGEIHPQGDSLDLDYSDLEAVMAQFTRDGRYWLPRPGETEPAQRMPDMDEMGIDVSVLFGGHSFLAASMANSPEIGRATTRAYNTHLARYCAHDPARLKGAALLPLQAPEAAPDELRRCVEELGFVAGVVPPHHRNGTLLDDPRLEALWSTAAELDVPICVHTLGIQISPAREVMPGYRTRKVYGSQPSMLALGSLILGGVLDRHPGLRVAFLETGAGWVPYVTERLQGAYETFSLKHERLQRDPQEQVRGDQLYFACEPEEATLPAVAELIGAGRLVLGSDYCHPEGQCPYTMRILAGRDDLSGDLKRRILHDNPARLYGLEL